MDHSRLYEAIDKRVSVRKYQQRPVEQALLDSLLAFAPDRLADVDVRVVPVERDAMHANLETSFAKFYNPPLFLALVARESPHFMLECGFRGEQLVLAAMSLGLGTCWLGGIFVEDKVRNLLGIEAPFRAVAVTPLGRPSTGLIDNALDGLVRLGAGSRPRMTLREFVFADTYGNPFDFSSDRPSAWERIFTAVRAAPSWANYQPWRFVVRDGKVYALAVPPREARGFKGSQLKAGMDYALLDLGIAMSHLHVACRAEGVPGSWELLEDDTSTLRARLRVPDEVRLLAVWK
jgi:nitroreductase